MDTIISLGASMLATLPQQDTGAVVPTQHEYLQSVIQMHPLAAVALAGCGVACLLLGFKFFKYIVLANAAAIGTFIGWQLGTLLEDTNPNMPLYGAAAVALLLACASWPLMKGAVGMMGGLAGALMGYGVWFYVARATGQHALMQYPWAGAIIGGILLGMLSFPAFKAVVVIFTAFEGSVVAVTGVVSLLARAESLHDAVIGPLKSSLYLLPLVIVLPTLLGLTVQYSSGKKKKPSGGGAGGGGGGS
jgi:hypothetical protein